MSLVAYDVSSDEEGDSEDEVRSVESRPTEVKAINGHISDEDEYDNSTSQPNSLEYAVPTKKLLNLPAPSQTKTIGDEADDELIPLAFDRLPDPKPYEIQGVVVEEDDEFLHKKEKPPEDLKPPPVTPRKGPVRIMVPSLSEFKDLDIGKAATAKPASTSTKSCGLLSLLPKPRNEAVFGKAIEKHTTSQPSTKAVTCLIPDSVKNQAMKKTQPSTSKKPKPVSTLVAHGSDSENSDAEGADFFSFNYEQKLPEVSPGEINAMVEKKTAQMAEALFKATETLEGNKNDPSLETDGQITETTQCLPSEQLEVDDRAIKVLMGSRAAKKRKVDEVNIVELSASQVLPDKDEWLRTALASSTSYQPRGTLVDEELAPGTRKKHQITYLAHQAKANELELQAMWSANRHTRRQTQGKYGF